MKYILTISFFLFYSHWVLAAGGDLNSIPWDIILKQFLNVTLTVSLLVFILIKPIKNLFKKRKEDYFLEKKRAEEIFKKTQNKRKDLEQKLEKLNITKDSTLTQVRKQVDEEKKKILDESHQLAKKMMSDVKSLMEAEKEKVILELKNSLLEKSMNLVREDIGKELSDDIKNKLRTRFSKEMRVNE